MKSTATSPPTGRPGNGTQDFEYERLVTYDREREEGPKIRILHLEPSSNHNAPLRFSLTTVDMEAPGCSYEAISYTPGDPVLCKRLHSIHSGRSLRIIATLDDALRKFRLPHTTRALWVDLTCIDQNNDSEKADQIPLMSKIYEGAQQILAWLGGNEEHEKVMKFLCTVSRLRNDYERLEWEVDSFENSKLSLESFLSLPYFEGKGSEEEVGLNCDVTLFCGGSSMSWTRFVVALGVLEASGIEYVDRELKNCRHVLKGFDVISGSNG